MGPILAAIIFMLFSTASFSMPMAITAAVACWCIIWWIFEPVPIPVTSLLPLAVFQITAVLDKNAVVQAYPINIHEVVMELAKRTGKSEKKGTQEA